MKLDEQLYRNYSELLDIILQCYIDLTILDSYQKMQMEYKETYKTFANFNSHYILLLQKDLALNVWKIYFDKDSNANTVAKFRNSVNEILRELGKNSVQVKKAKGINPEVEKVLLDMRKQFLAHMDMTRGNGRLEISDMKNMLDIICAEFNNVCDVVNDDDIKRITDIQLGMIEMSYTIEMRALFS